MMKVKKSILIVEPDHKFQKEIGRPLEGSGYSITIAKDGQEALDILSNSVFDLIVSALNMPNVNGIQLMQEIRRTKMNVPVIFITAYGDVESYMNLMNMGAFDYLNMPVEDQELLRVTRSAFEKGHDALQNNYELSSARTVWRESLS
jgi:two-component system response regulator (stage 0 sporulation protein F)